MNIFPLHNNDAVAAFKALTFEVACSSLLPGHTSLNKHTRPLDCVFKTKIPHIIKKSLLLIRLLCDAVLLGRTN